MFVKSSYRRDGINKSVFLLIIHPCVHLPTFPTDNLNFHTHLYEFRENIESTGDWGQEETKAQTLLPSHGFGSENPGTHTEVETRLMNKFPSVHEGTVASKQNMSDKASLGISLRKNIFKRVPNKIWNILHTRVSGFQTQHSF